MIGKTIAGSDNLTEKSGRQRNGNLKGVTEISLKNNEWQKFQQEFNAAKGHTIKINTAIDNSGFEQLKNSSALSDYVVKQFKDRENLDINEINDQGFQRPYPRTTLPWETTPERTERCIQRTGRISRITCYRLVKNDRLKLYIEKTALSSKSNASKVALGSLLRENKTVSCV